jgi:hypothetical protein
MRVMKRVWFVVITIVAAVVITISTIDLINPASNGPAGTVVITRCVHIGTRHNCYGDFTSKDGRVRVDDALVAGEGNGQPGQRFSGFGDSTGKTVTVPSSAERWTDIGAILVFLITWLIMFCFVVYLPLRRRRRAQQVATA